MTDSKSKTVAKRAGKPAPQRTMARDLSEHMLYTLRLSDRLTFPSKRYQNDPVGFCRMVLGVEPWAAQVRILEAVRDHMRVAVRSGHKVGKASDLGTPVVTPSGFRTMGELQIGDKVYDERGQVCTIVSTSTWDNRPCYRVTFDDGSEIIVDERHEWLVWNARERRQRWRSGKGKPEIIETRDFVGRLESKDRGRNFSVDVAAPLEGAGVEPLIDPYVLGVWLGDGTEKHGEVTNPDPEVWQQIEQRGYALGKAQIGHGCVRRTLLGFSGQLRQLGLLGHKHIPGWAFGASAEWRRDVLRGLVDTDGHVQVNGVVEIVQVRRELARDVFRLIASLGYKPCMRVDRAQLNGRDMGPRYRVFYTPHDEGHCYVKRKRAAVLPTRTKWQWTRQRMIVSVEPVEPRTTKCIEVDSPSHLFLCGDACIPTHNSKTAAIVALWYYCSWPDARAVMSSTTARQVDQILWREVRMVRSRAGRCVHCKAEMQALVVGGVCSQVEAEHRVPKPCPHSALIEEEPGDMARTGLKSADFREIVGFTAKEAEAVAGISGENLIYILDEASGIQQPIFDAIEGNRAGGARLLMFSNPTKNEGEFYDAFHGKSAFYHGMTVSSEETPNVVEGRRVIPGLATAEWIEEKKAEWGESSPLYTIRVKGEHATQEAGKIFSVHAIEEAEERWESTPEQGRLFIGLDPSGASGLGDETAIAARRGLKCLQIRVHLGVNLEGIMVHLLATLSRLKVPRETPVVVFDRENRLGVDLQTQLQSHLDRHPGAFEIVPVRASDRAQRQPDVYHRMRDALTANLEQWMRDGGAIPEDAKLSAELHVMEWRQNQNGLLKVIPKDLIKKIIGRSPDRYDALALSVWEPLSLRSDVTDETKRKVADTGGDAYERSVLDPYEGAGAWDKGELD